MKESLEFSLHLHEDGSKFLSSLCFPKNQVPSFVSTKIQEQLQQDETLVCAYLFDIKLEGQQFFLTSFPVKNGSTNFSKEIKVPLESDFLPECIIAALHCTSRKMVIDYINQYLLPGESVKTVKRSHENYKIKNKDTTQTIIGLFHDNFSDRCVGFDGHMGYGPSHPENPHAMYRFVYNRSQFFQQNYEKGQQYQKMSWLNPTWLMLFFDYYVQALRNLAAKIGIGDESQYCNDFKLGQKHAKENINIILKNEIIATGESAESFPTGEASYLLPGRAC